MPIYAPSKRINPTIQRRSGGGRKTVYAGLFLTSMVDMFAIMVIFLLMSFSAEGELVILPKGLELPKARNTGILERAPSIVVSQEQVLFEGEELALTPDVIAQNGWVIPKLQDALKDYQKTLEDELKTRVLSGMPEEEAVADMEKNKKINISVDRRLMFALVKKIIYNAGYAGFPDFRFTVFAKGKKKEAN
jgi:biopolymer transport protein ExbD